jgi:hypothetical protein
MLRRLKRDRPDLAAKVVAGELTAHAAAVEAGIRQRMVQHPATVDGFISAARRWLSEEECRQVADGLRKRDGERT